MAGWGDVIGGLGGLAGGLAGYYSQSDEGDEYSEEAVQAWRDLQTPTFDYTTLTPEELVVVGEYRPEVYEFVRPEDAVTVEEGAEGRQAQLNALQYYDQIQRQGLPVAERLAAEEAIQQLARQQARGTESAIQGYAMRGRGGGGTELAARIGAGQASADLARGLGQDLTQQMIANRLSAAAQGAGVGSQMRSQDYATSLANANIWNNFNQYVSEGLTQAARDAANTRNTAQAYNLGEQTRVSDYNIENRNDYAQWRKTYNDQLKQQMYENEVAKASGLSGAATGAATNAYASDAANTSTLSSLGRSLGTAAGGTADLLSTIGSSDDEKKKKKNGT